ncbi:MAG TPA: hypothetical protein PKD54_02560 [Pirellulaceae bacterium]|nr:hypothetical protein [Pirellulaceae bacterium]
MNELFWRCAIVPVVMALVAISHVHQFCRDDRSSWGAGCGLGMFATVDFHGTRFFRCYVTVQAERLPATFEGEFARQALTARIVPTQQRLDELAALLSQQTWRVIRFRPSKSLSDQTCSAAADSQIVQTIATCAPEQWFSRHRGADIIEMRSIEVQRIDIELWGLRLDLETRRVEAFRKEFVSVHGSAMRGSHP